MTIHVVVMGDPFVGLIHPCKIYNILRLGTPVLYIGPAESHITDLWTPPNTENSPSSPGFKSQVSSFKFSPDQSPGSTLDVRCSAFAVRPAVSS